MRLRFKSFIALLLVLLTGALSISTAEAVAPQFTANIPGVMNVYSTYHTTFTVNSKDVSARYQVDITEWSQLYISSYAVTNNTSGVTIQCSQNAQAITCRPLTNMPTNTTYTLDVTVIALPPAWASGQVTYLWSWFDGTNKTSSGYGNVWTQ